MKRYRDIKLDSDVNEDEEMSFDDFDDLNFEPDAENAQGEAATEEAVTEEVVTTSTEE